MTVAQTRARYGVPRGTKLVAPEHEAALVTAVKKGLELVYASKYGEAEKSLAVAEKRWPGAPGLLAARVRPRAAHGPARGRAHRVPARARRGPRRLVGALPLGGDRAARDEQHQRRDRAAQKGDRGRSRARPGVAHARQGVRARPRTRRRSISSGRTTRRGSDSLSRARLDGRELPASHVLGRLPRRGVPPRPRATSTSPPSATPSRASTRARCGCTSRGPRARRRATPRSGRCAMRCAGPARTPELRRQAAAALGKALWEAARAEGIATERDRTRVREAADLLVARRRSPARRRGARGDRRSPRGRQRVLRRRARRAHGAGARQATTRANNRARTEADAFANYQTAMRVGRRDDARAELVRAVAAALGRRRVPAAARPARHRAAHRRQGRAQAARQAADRRVRGAQARARPRSAVRPARCAPAACRASTRRSSAPPRRSSCATSTRATAPRSRPAARRARPARRHRQVRARRRVHARLRARRRRADPARATAASTAASRCSRATRAGASISRRSGSRSIWCSRRAGPLLGRGACERTSCSTTSRSATSASS